MRADETEAVRAELLGGYRVWVGPRAVEEGDWRLRKAGALVALLALAPGHGLHRDEVMDLLWPDLAPEPAANNLHRTLHAARRTLKPHVRAASPGHLPLQDGWLSLTSGGGLRVDVNAFEERAALARRLSDVATFDAAIELYGGELLPGYRYEGWAEERRAHLRKVYLELLVERAALHEARSEFDAGVESLLAAVSVEPAHEEVRVALMRLYAISGRRRQALQQYEVFERLTAPWTPATARRLYEDIRSGRFPVGASSEAADVRGAGTPATHNLPDASTNFVGRRRELAEVRRMLAMTSLLTITGAGGSGKTRLAVEAARGLVASYPDGVWLVELASLSDPALVPRMVAETVGVKEEPGRPVEDTLSEELSNKKMLLVLDNCEHLRGSAAGLARTLTGGCPGIALVATSREALGVAGEMVWRIPPLSTPGHGASVAQLRAYEAARLFEDRARGQVASFALDPENALAVAEICRKLEGMPLAIELAAARVRTLSVARISDRIDDALGLLTAGSGYATPRQRTLRGVLDWSHHLLSGGERALLRRLAVFASGFTLEAAEQVGAGGGVGEHQVVDGLASLVDKSLVVVAPSRVRYRLLEPVRQYASDKLDEAGEGEDARRSHAAFFTRLAEAAEPELVGEGQARSVRRLETEHDNLRVAMEWQKGRGDAEGVLRVAGALWWYWFLRGHYDEGRGWLEAALAEGDDVPAGVRAKALAAAGDLAFLQSEYDHARSLLEEALVLYRALEDDRGLASVVQLLGSMAREQGRYSESESLHAESLALWRKLGDDWGVAQSLNYLGFVACLREDLARATELCTQTLSMFRLLGDSEGIAWSTIILGMAGIYRADDARARPLLDEGLALARQTGYREGVAWALNGLGILARREGRTARADALLRESLDTHRELGDRWRTCSLLEELAGTAADLGRFERGSILLGAAGALRETLSDPVPPCEHHDRERDAAAVRAGMDRASFEAAREAGRAISLKRVYEYALTEDAPPQDPPPPRPEPSGLTRREGEVARLVAAGLTNREISARLSISGRTVDTHVGRILKKLEVESRKLVAHRLAQRRDTETV